MKLERRAKIIELIGRYEIETQELQLQTPILPVCFKSVSVLYAANTVSGLSPTAAEPFYELQDITIQLRNG